MKKITISIIVFFVSFVLLACENTIGLTDQEHIALAYTGSGLADDHVFVSISETEMNERVEDGEVLIVYYGGPGCPFCRFHVSTFDEVAKSVGLEVIYYLHTVFSNQAHVDRAFRLEELYAHETPELQLNAMSIPNIFVFHQGELIKQLKSYFDSMSETGLINDWTMEEALADLYQFGLNAMEENADS